MSTAINRLLGWHILLIGAGASLILFLILYFAMIKPKREELDGVISATEGTKTAGGTAEKVAQNDRTLKQEQVNAININRDWNEYAQLYMPNIEFNPDKPDLLYQYEHSIYSDNGKHYGLRELPGVWGRWVTAWYDGQAKAGINRPVGMVFPVGSFPTDPNAISKLDSMQFPLDKPWHVTVMAKSFDQAMAHLKRFNGIAKRGMPVVSNVALSGQSPDLQVDYDLMLYIIPPTKPPIADPVLTGGGGGQGGGGGGFGGGMGGPGFSSGGTPSFAGASSSGGPGAGKATNK